MQSDPSRVKDADLLEADRRVPRIVSEEGKVLVSKLSDVVWKLAVVEPEVRISEVVHSGVARPAWR